VKKSQGLVVFTVSGYDGFMGNGAFPDVCRKKKPVAAGSVTISHVVKADWCRIDG